MAILGDVGDPGRERRGRAAERHDLATEPDLAGVGMVDSEQYAGDLGPPGADQTREPEDLAGPDRRS